MSFRKKFYNSLRSKSGCEMSPTPSVERQTVNNTHSSLLIDAECSSAQTKTENISIETNENINLKNTLNNIQSNEEVVEVDKNTCDTVLNKTTGVSNGNEQSVGFPDGLAMDPLSPSAMAVSTEFMDRLGSGLTLLKEHGKKVQKYMWKNRKFDILKKSWNSIVTVVLIEAKDLPDSPASGNNTVQCKFRLGTETFKTKMITKSHRPTWRERFNLHLYDENNLELTVWHKGKQKNFMGRCVIDLSRLEKERTHDLWQQLECGYGEIHLLVTVSGTSRPVHHSQPAITNGISNNVNNLEQSVSDVKYAWYKLNEWDEVGELNVTVHGAKGLSTMGLGTKADAFCVLELDNSRVQTHTIHSNSEPQWNKTYTFEISDITSAIDLSVYDEAKFNNSMKGETLGKLTIPLLRINNGEKRWYALKDRTKKRSARGNCPRILLEMSINWNPIKASFRVLSPKETKYVQKPTKFDIPLIYSNLVFIKDIFHLIKEANEALKRLFEWENREKSAVALVMWLVFWLVFRPWMTPLLLLPPFLYHMVTQRSCNNNPISSMDPIEEDVEEEDISAQRDDKTIKTRLYSLQDLTFTIKNGIDYIVSTIERLKNLSNFTVPYLSYLAITALLALSAALYIIPFRYFLMALGIYKFTRKFLKPDRVPNNDLLDFLSRVPDDEILKEWRELKVPEPNLQRMGSIRK